MIRKLFISSIGLLAFFIVNAQVEIFNLRCEMLENPFGIDVTQPRLSWQISSDQRDVQQTAYQVIVSSSREKLLSDDGDVWNSAKVNSSKTVHVLYGGKVLQKG